MTAMGSDQREAERLFEQLAARYLADTRVSEGRMFGSTVLKVDGKVFAMLVKGELVMKLPKERVEQLVASGAGTPFDPGHGRPSKDWVSVSPRFGRDWEHLASEAFELVGPSALARQRRTPKTPPTQGR